MKHYGHLYIDGAWVLPSSDRTFELVNPATEAQFGTLALGTAGDVDKAVAAAKRVAPAFAATSKAERITLLQSIIDGFVAREDDILAAMTEEMGAPVRLKAQTGAALASLREGIATLQDYEFETWLKDSLIRRESIGVAGLITPWNWPVQMLCNKVAFAFAAGCPVVVKPSQFTAPSTILFTEVCHDAGVPAGYFNLVNGGGSDVGEAISAHDDIAVVSFTGSTRAGALVAQAAAASIKRVSQELGGKSANIVMPDADLKAAAEFNVARGFSNSGQSCHSPTRLLVHEDQLEEVVGYLADAVERTMKVGDPTDPATTHGPVVNRAQYDSIQKYIDSAIREGARLVCGGPGRPEGLNRGYYIRPTIFADVTPDMTIAREEIFGMVTAVMTYRSLDEAVAIANDTEYGLGAYVWGADREASLNLARRLEAGRVFYNGAPSNTYAPMGGYKKSGNGREMGHFGLEEYLETKAILGFG